MSVKELLTEMNAHSKELIEDGKKPSYEPYGKIAIKVGQFSKTDRFRRENPDLNYNNESIKKAETIKDI